MPIKSKRELVDKVAAILEIPSVKIDINRTLIPEEYFSKIATLLGWKFLIFQLPAKIDYKKLPRRGEPTLHQLLQAMNFSEAFLDR